MGGKYASPPVKLVDVMKALRPLKSPLVWVVGFRPTAYNTTRVRAVVELQVVDHHGGSWVWRRWGQDCSATSDTGPTAALLLAAQQAHWSVEGWSDDDLLARVTWDMGVMVASMSRPQG